jgi:cation transport regulator ChaB
MPYRRVSELPKAVRDHLPEPAQEIYLEAYNSAWEQYEKPGKRRDGASREETASRWPGRLSRRNTRRTANPAYGRKTNELVQKVRR